MVRSLSLFVVLLVILFRSSVVQAVDLPSTQLGGSLGYAIWEGDTQNSKSLEIFLRHYFGKEMGIETSVMYFTKTSHDVDFLGEKYEFSRTILPVHVSFVYSPIRNSNRALNFYLGGGILYARNSLTLIGLEPESPAGEIEFELMTGFSLDLKLRSHVAVSTRLLLAFHPAGFHYVAPHIGVGWSF